MSTQIPASAIEEFGAALAKVAAELAVRIVEERLPRATAGTAAPVDIRGLARALNISEVTVRRMMRSGCPVEWYGSTPRFDVEAVRSWGRARGKGSVSGPQKSASAPAGPIPGVARKTRKAKG